MTFEEYQARAKETDQAPGEGHDQKIIPLLGLAGEAGELLSEYKKHLRDGDAHRLFSERVAEELGDLLWYISTVATKFGLQLEDVATKNICKTYARWGHEACSATSGLFRFFDDDYPVNERLPRYFEVKISDTVEHESVKMRAFMNGKQIGDPLTDNAYSSDGYRFHDIFHFGFAAGLAWSPVTRRNLQCKRKSNPKTDEVEDGGRATAIEEGLSAIIFDYAKQHRFLEDIKALDYDLLKLIKRNTESLEVGRRSVGDWERTIINSYEVWRDVARNKGGTVIVDLETRRLTYRK
jgi:NTP pyrophosphatase (non-canonical NTP hydrolase)